MPLFLRTLRDNNWMICWYNVLRKLLNNLYKYSLSRTICNAPELKRSTAPPTTRAIHIFLALSITEPYCREYEFSPRHGLPKVSWRQGTQSRPSIILYEYSRTSLSRMAIFHVFHPGQRGIRNSEEQHEIRGVLLKELSLPFSQEGLSQ